jgi:hypothetical protein
MWVGAVWTLDMSVVSILYLTGTVNEVNMESVCGDCVSPSVCLFVCDAVPATKLLDIRESVHRDKTMKITNKVHYID